MNIYHQIGKGGDDLLEWYQIKKTIQKVMINDSLEHMLFEKRDDNDSAFLIDESYFNLICCPIEGMIYEAISIEQINSLVADKVKHIKKQHNINGYMLMYDIDNIVIDDQPSTYLLGKTGYIKRDIFFIFIKPSLAIACPTLLKHNVAGPKIYPSSYFTVQFMVKRLSIPSFIILSFHDNHTKIISIKNGFYQAIDSLDRGMNHLKQILISNNVIQYFNQTDQDIDANSMAKQIIIESIEFFNNIILNRIKEHNHDITSCIINMPTQKNSIFHTQFIAQYSKVIGGYIIPNSINTQLNQYKKQRKMNEIDILTYLNFADKKELI